MQVVVEAFRVVVQELQVVVVEAVIQDYFTIRQRLIAGAGGGGGDDPGLVNLEEALAEAAALVILLVDMVVEGHILQEAQVVALEAAGIIYKEEQAGQVAVEDIMVSN